MSHTPDTIETQLRLEAILKNYWRATGYTGEFDPVDDDRTASPHVALADILGVPAANAIGITLRLIRAELL